MKYLLDADAVIDHLTEHVNLTSQLPELDTTDLALSAVTLIELYTGVYGSRAPLQAERDLRTFLQSVAVLPLNQRVIIAAARLRSDLLSRRLPIKHRAYDLIAAATALAYDLTLVTSNTRDYLDIPGLSLFNPRSAR